MKDLSVKRVFNNGLISVAFQGLPVVLALVFIPLNIKYIGDTLWGLYSLSVALLFLFLYFNIGINPSINKKLASILSENNKQLEYTILSNGFYFNLLAAISLGLIFYFLSPVLVVYITNESDNYSKEAIQLFRLASIAGTLSLLISFFRNVYEAKQKFYIVSILRAILSSVIIITPTIGFYLGLDIVESFNIIILTYISVIITYLIIFLKEYSFPTIHALDKPLLKELLLFGIWVTGYSLIHPVYIYLDRFFISSSLGLNEVSFYTTPYDLVSKMTLISGSITAAFFPAISYWYANQEIDYLKKSFKKTFRFLFWFLFPICLTSYFVAPYFLNFWINESYLVKSTGVFRILITGYFFSSLSLVFLRTMYGIGKPKLVFLLSLAELPLYLFLLVFLVSNFGIEGAAWTFLTKALLDCLILYYLSTKSIGQIFKLKEITTYLLVAFLMIVITILI